MSNSNESENRSSSPANEFAKGFLWGFVAFVHVALVTVIIYKFKLNCLPLKFVEMIACTDPTSARCPVACDPSNDFFFFILVGATALAAVFLPLGFAVYRLMIARRQSGGAE